MALILMIFFGFWLILGSYASERVALKNHLFTEAEIDFHFEEFKNQFKRTYLTLQEESNRRQIFARNLEFITRHNQDYETGRNTYSLRVNQFADKSSAEFRGNRNIGHVETKKRIITFFHQVSNLQDLPDSIDWTTKGVVTPVKDQGGCTGAGFAFSVAATIESQLALSTGKLTNLSAQNLLDCTYPSGTSYDSCEGYYNLNDDAFEYVVSNQGIDTDQSYPYQEMTNDCRYRTADRGANITSFVNVPQYDEQALKHALATVGPIAATIDAVEDSFQFYYQGVYYEPKCDQNFLSHFVTVVGYGTLNGTEYWKVKNSYGVYWGNIDAPGYILMARNAGNNCGIATMASYPVM